MPNPLISCVFPSVRRIKLIAAVILLSGCATHASQDHPDLSPLTIADGYIVDDAGQRVTLSGCNLGNWLILEMWMFAQDVGVPDEHTMEAVLAERFGEPEKERLMGVYRDHWITERDIQMIKSFGMNTLRLPFEYELLEDDDRPMQLKPDAFKYLDRCIEWAEKYDMYVVLDLHGAAGRQSNYQHSGHADQNKFWSDPENQARTLWLWGEIAKRYADRPSVMGYEALNEPWHGGEEKLLDFMKRWYATVRPLAPDKILVMPGMGGGIRFYGHRDDHGWTNVMYDMHWYPGLFGWGTPTPWVHRGFLNDLENNHYPYMRKLGAPMMHGEMNVVYDRAGGPAMTRLYFDRYAEYGWVPTIWSYKNLTWNGKIGSSFWGMVSNGEPVQRVNFRTSSKAEIESFFESFSTMTYAVDEDLRRHLTAPRALATIDELAPLPPRLAQPPANDALPEGWTATDIGDARTGGQRVADGTITVFGGGNDIWGPRDQFRFLHQPLAGDFELSATVQSVGWTHGSAKAGLMARATLDPGSPFVMINVKPDGRPELLYRTTAGGGCTSVNIPPKTGGWGEDLSVQLRLTRTQGRYTAAYKDGWSDWVTLDLTDVPALAGKVETGLATLSHDNETLVQAVYRGITLEQ